MVAFIDEISGVFEVMAIDLLVAPLLKIELFQGLRPLQLTEIARCAERIMFRAGQKIVEAGGDGDAAFVIVQGEAARTSGPGYLGQPEPIVSGSIIAEMAMLVETEHTSTIVAAGPVKALKITRAGLYKQMLEDGALAEHLVAKINNRLLSLAEDLRTIDSILATEGGGGSDSVPLKFPSIAALSHDLMRPALDTRH